MMAEKRADNSKRANEPDNSANRGTPDTLAKSSKPNILSRGVSNAANVLQNKFSKSSSPSKPLSFDPWMIFAIAVVNYYLHWQTGFLGNILLALGIDIITIAIFMFAGFDFKESFSPFLFQFVIPAVILLLPPSLIKASMLSQVIAIFIVLPWWLIFAYGLEKKKNPNSITVRWIAVGAIIIAFFFFLPTIVQVFRDSDYTLDQEQMANIKEFVSGRTSESIIELKVTFCSTTQLKTRQECEEKYRPDEKGFANRLTIREKDEFMFTMDVPSASFFKGGRLDGDKITSYFTAESNMPGEKSIVFSCGLSGRGFGEANPSALTLQTGIPVTDEPIVCKLDVFKRGKPTFGFNASVKDVVAQGYRNFIIKAEPEDGQEISLENDALLKAFVDEKKKSGELDPNVGKGDLLQPIVHVGIRSFNVEPKYVYSVKNGEKIELALYLRNKGNGRASNIKNIEFTTPSNFALDETNCGINYERLETSIKNLRKDQITNTPIAACNLVAQGSDFSSAEELKKIGVTITYDYTVSRTQEVII